MATGTISNSNGRIALASGTYFSLGCTMGAGEYPTGVVFPLEAANGTKPYWFNRDVQYPTPDTYTIYLSNSNGSIKYTLGTVTIHNNQSDVTQKSFSVSCPDLRGQALYLSGNNGYLELRFGSGTSMSVTINTAAAYSACGAPTAVAVSRSRGTVTINWSGATAGTNNAITGYDIIRNTSQSTSGAITTHTAVTTGGQTNAPGAGTFYYGVRTRGAAGASYYSGYKWSGAITVPSKPSVSAGTVITDTQMDTLRTWINTSGITDIADGAQVKASEGNTYRNTLTAGSSKVEASWYNTAAG